MESSRTDPTLSLSEHVAALYPLARVLAAPDEAAELVRGVYKQAAQVPPKKRPSNERGWLFQLMMTAHEGALRSAGPAVHPKREPSFTGDPFREEVAETITQRALPVAFAACSIHERLILSIDVLGNPSDEALAVALETSTTNARSIRDRARSALRECLRDVLSEPEGMIVDVGLSEETLRDQLQTFLIERFDPPPESLRHSVTDILVSEQPERNRPLGSSIPSGTWIMDRVRSAVRTIFSVKGVIVGAVLALLLVFGARQTSWVFTSSPSPRPTPLIEYAIQGENDVQNRRPVEDPPAAAAYIQSTWNRRVTIPTIEGTTLQSVGHVPLSQDADVPVLLYADTERSTQIALFAFNYALLDQTEGEVILERDLRTKLAGNNSLLVEANEGHAVAIWRQRDEIFVVVAPDMQPEALRSRIQL